jgi:UDP-glucuronate decarboxylase
MKSRVIDEDIQGILSTFNNELTKLEGKNIFITGGKGFIGSYIIDVLSQFNATSKKPCKIVTFDRNPVVKDSRLDHLLTNPNITFLTGDAGKPFNVPEKMDILIHTASRSNVSSILKNPLETADANVYGVRNLLEYARDNPVENFIFFSSAEIYGNPVNEFIPTPETYTGNIDVLSPLACYSESKRFSETLCSIFFR